MQKLIVIAGPTASGKTDLAIKIAREINGAVVNADSRQVYRGMNIGTGKPEELKMKNVKCKIEGINHCLFNIVNPDEAFTVAHFKTLALAAIRKIHLSGNIPLLVGGTGLYIRSIVENLKIPAVPPNKKLRATFEHSYTDVGHPYMKEAVLEHWHQKLLALDPHAKIDFHNPRRLIRALEIVMATGTSLNDAQKKGPQLFETLELGVDVPREELYVRIDNRVDAMITGGLEDEVRGLFKQYPNFFSLPASESPGYAEWQDYFSGKDSLAEVIQKIKFNTHAYARRQITWFNKNKNIKWIRDASAALAQINNFLI